MDRRDLAFFIEYRNYPKFTENPITRANSKGQDQTFLEEQSYQGPVSNFALPFALRLKLLANLFEF